jgi:hypothetical protein
MPMEYDKHLAILHCINIIIWIINFCCGKYKFYKMIKQCVPLIPMYQKESLVSKLTSSACSTKKSSHQMLKYSHWLKHKFCLPQ